MVGRPAAAAGGGGGGGGLILGDRQAQGACWDSVGCPVVHLTFFYNFMMSRSTGVMSLSV
jgi:hypothetical protein